MTKEFGSDGSCGSKTVSESRWVLETGTEKMPFHFRSQ